MQKIPKLSEVMTRRKVAQLNTRQLRKKDASKKRIAEMALMLRRPVAGERTSPKQSKSSPKEIKVYKGPKNKDGLKPRGRPPVIGITNQTSTANIKEYYPNKIKRVVKRKVVLKPKQGLLIGSKRKAAVPLKGIKSPLPKRSKTSTSIQEMIELSEKQGLTDEDFLEILTCESPVWWEDPPDDSFYYEEAIFRRKPKTQSRTEETVTSNPIDLKPNKIPDTKQTDAKFMTKRSKLESLLGNIKNKLNTFNNNTINKINDKSVLIKQEHAETNVCNIKKNEKTQTETVESSLQKENNSPTNNNTINKINDKVDLNKQAYTETNVCKIKENEKTQTNEGTAERPREKENNSITNNNILNKNINKIYLNKQTHTDTNECNTKKDDKKETVENSLTKANAISYEEDESCPNTQAVESYKIKAAIINQPTYIKVIDGGTNKQTTKTSECGAKEEKELDRINTAQGSFNALNTDKDNKLVSETESHSNQDEISKENSLIPKSVNTSVDTDHRIGTSRNLGSEDTPSTNEDNLKMNENINIPMAFQNTGDNENTADSRQLNSTNLLVTNDSKPDSEVNASVVTAGTDTVTSDDVNSDSEAVINTSPTLDSNADVKVDRPNASTENRSSNSDVLKELKDSEESIQKLTITSIEKISSPSLDVEYSSSQEFGSVSDNFKCDEEVTSFTSEFSFDSEKCKNSADVSIEETESEISKIESETTVIENEARSIEFETQNLESEDVLKFVDGIKESNDDGISLESVISNIENDQNLEEQKDKEYMTVYKIISCEDLPHNETKIKNTDDKDLKNIESSEVLRAIISEKITESPKGNLNAFYKKCKNSHRKSKSTIDIEEQNSNQTANDHQSSSNTGHSISKKEQPTSNIVHSISKKEQPTLNIEHCNSEIEIQNSNSESKTETDALCRSCETSEKSILISNENIVKYCLKCSSIFESENCTYCDKKAEIDKRKM